MFFLCGKKRADPAMKVSIKDPQTENSRILKMCQKMSRYPRKDDLLVRTESYVQGEWRMQKSWIYRFEKELRNW